jgi:hypothetical protein
MRANTRWWSGEPGNAVIPWGTVELSAVRSKDVCEDDGGNHKAKDGGRSWELWFAKALATKKIKLEVEC